MQGSRFFIHCVTVEDLRAHACGTWGTQSIHSCACALHGRYWTCSRAATGSRDTRCGRTVALAGRDRLRNRVGTPGCARHCRCCGCAQLGAQWQRNPEHLGTPSRSVATGYRLSRTLRHTPRTRTACPFGARSARGLAAPLRFGKHPRTWRSCAAWRVACLCGACAAPAHARALRALRVVQAQ